MKTMMTMLAGATLALASVAASAGTATVTFVHPENYVDFPTWADDRQDVLRELGEHFAKRARALPANEELRVEVLQCDLAGRLRPSVTRTSEIRVIRPIDWPTMQVRYTLLRDGQVISQGEERLSDMQAVTRANRYFSDDPLRFEKMMIDDWFKDRIAVR